MNNLKIWFSGLALLAWSTQTMAQNEVDALRYSQLSFGGTARIQGIAGAQTALGADASTMAGNPAGLGLYRRGEFSFTPGFNFNETESTLKGNVTSDSRNTFNISQLGIVFTDRKADDVVNKWRSGSFGIGFTRLNDFQMRTTYEGPVAENNSLLQSFQDNITTFNINQAQLDAEYGTNGDNITTLEGLAYANFLIEVDTLGNLFVPVREGAIRQNETIFSKGAQNQWDFSYGASYMDKLFIGGALSLVNVRYDQQRTYTETAASDPYFSTMTLMDRFTTRGSGINFRIGAIYKPVDALRLGASIQTPTFTSLTDDYTTDLTVDYKPGTFPNNQTHFFSSTIPGTYDYNLTTPFRANGGIAYFIGKYGFISADAEFVNYSGASFNQDNDLGAFSNINSRISTAYKGTMNYRVGAEARFDIFRVRGGFAYYGDPYNASNFDRKRTYYTGGIGLKEKNFFVDAAYVYSKYNSVYSPYKLTDNSQPVVETKVTNGNFLITAGFNF